MKHIKIHSEVMLNQIIGIIGGWLIVMFIFPLFQHLDQSIVATISSVLFFIWSYTRSFIIRLIFENKRINDEKN